MLWTQCVVQQLWGDTMRHLTHWPTDLLPRHCQHHLIHYLFCLTRHSWLHDCSKPVITIKSQTFSIFKPIGKTVPKNLLTKPNIAQCPQASFPVLSVLLLLLLLVSLALAFPALSFLPGFGPQMGQGPSVVQLGWLEVYRNHWGVQNHGFCKPKPTTTKKIMCCGIRLPMDDRWFLLHTHFVAQSLSTPNPWCSAKALTWWAWAQTGSNTHQQLWHCLIWIVLFHFWYHVACPIWNP